MILGYRRTTNLVASVVYNAGSKPATITYSNGDKDEYVWDALSQHMTQWKFTIGTGAVTDTGVLTWNANTTLKQLQITDNIVSTDTQTCTTGHDDLIRITSWNCGALANATYSYSPDYAGNVTKGGSFNFSPGYTPSNNRMLAPYTYDAKGNLLHDATLGQDYTYDARGSMISYAGNAITNNAVGNPIEKVVGTTHTYMVNTPIGMLGTASALTTRLWFKIPLPGGEIANFSSSGNLRLSHRDFVGNTRLMTNEVQRTLYSVFCYGPMGELYCGAATGPRFEGVMQDTSTGLFDYGSERYSGTQGRTTSPTGGPNGYVKTNNPF